MKKIIILVLALLSTGIVLSNSLKKANVAANVSKLETKKNILQKSDNKAPLYDAVGRAD
ncbi:hypothetical protein BDD43_4182 [Mucilaginibacter gracilis]|uniref:Uncharacterized protein n=1 Tax=Mucilaginibacter gracilis TaxID=423350 RepID=A0A495J4T3_9SPHI|nr:hypothetical protein [Mucilaginibacter gracilis]RKR83967.1 hypothetical protein BDD43_4182 [Mucilaginibacter gracilis]